jgi:hypothetical protein
MPWQKRWPPFVSQRVVDDRAKALESLERASGDLKESAARAIRTHRVADDLDEARQRNHFSESMEALFAQRGAHPRRSS